MMRIASAFIFTSAMLLGTVSAFAVGSGEGYAWANKPTQSNYIPSAAFAHNSSRGPIKISRAGIGNYQVRFAGLGGKGAAGGHAQVSAYGGGSEMCKVKGWNSAQNDFIVDVRCFKSNGQAVDTRYLVNISWPSKAQAVHQIIPATPAILTPLSSNQTLPKRSISAEGNVVFTYPDGRIVEYYDGGFKTTMPDGSVSIASYSTQAPVAIPTDPPAGSTRDWLADHNASLLGIIKTLVGFDQSVVDDYLAFEGLNLSVYEKISKRRTIISRLAKP